MARPKGLVPALMLVATLFLVSAAPIGATGIGLGRHAPEWELRDPEGRPHRLSTLKGSVVVLAFWASWSEPSLALLSHMETIRQKLAPSGVQLVAVHCKDGHDPIPAFRKSGAEFTLLLDGTSEAARYGVTRLPTVLVLDPAGKVTFWATGFGPGAAEILDREVGEALHQIDAPTEEPGRGDAGAAPAGE